MVGRIVKEDCENLEKCLKYMEMTLDSSSVSCDNCPAYEPS